MTLLIVALVLGAVGAGLSILYLNAREAQLREALRPKSQPVPVVVASRDLVKGDRLDTSTLSVRQIPSEFVDPNAVRPEEFDSIKGEVIIQNLARGKPLLKSFVGREFPLDFSDTIPERRRAMTIQVDEINSISGLIRPGNRIDLFVNLPASALDKQGAKGAAKGAGNQIMPVLENVEVLATGESTARDYEEKVRLLRGGVGVRPDTHYTTLTLNVTPREAALVSMAQDKGDLLALLRNRKDTSGSGFVKVSTETIKANAQRLATVAAVRAAAARADGNLVVGEDGVIRTRDGKVLANQNLVVAEDGTIMTKDGVVLSGRGLRIDEQGRLVTADGKVVDPDKIRVTSDGQVVTTDGVVLSGNAARTAGKITVRPDGTVVTESGIVLNGVKVDENGKLVLKGGDAARAVGKITVRPDGTVVSESGVVLKGVKVDENGKLVLQDGTVVDPDDVLVRPDGTVVKRGDVLVRPDGTVVRRGDVLVRADGTVVDPNDVVIRADGTVMTKDGKVLEGVKAGRMAGKLRVDENGDIVTESGAVIKGARLNEDGKLVLADGSVVDPEDVIVNADGTVTRRDGTVLEGVVAENTGLPGARGITPGGVGPGYEVDYLVGGVSEDSVLTLKKVPVLK